MTNNQLVLREFMEEVWNNKNINNVDKYIHNEYNVFLDEADPWE